MVNKSKLEKPILDDLGKFIKGGKEIKFSNPEDIRKELEKKSKPREELISPKVFKIKEALVETYHNSISPMSEMVYGGRSSSYKVGNSAKTILKITTAPGAKLNECEFFSIIDTIQYDGDTNLEKGDVIKAYIEKYRIEEIEDQSGPVIEFRYPKKQFYIERDFKDKEIVNKIEKLNPNNLEEVLKTYEIKDN